MAGPFSRTEILQLQRTVGNRALVNLLATARTSMQRQPGGHGRSAQAMLDGDYDEDEQEEIDEDIDDEAAAYLSSSRRPAPTIWAFAPAELHEEVRSNARQAELKKEVSNLPKRRTAGLGAVKGVLDKRVYGHLENRQGQVSQLKQRQLHQERELDEIYAAAPVTAGKQALEAAERTRFVASKPNQPMATAALGRANQDVAMAGRIYDTLYSELGFHAQRIALLTATASEAGMLDLATVIPPAIWSPFLVAATTTDALIAFALAHKADLAGVANAPSVLRVWQANAAHVTSVADANTILALALVNNDVAKGVAAAKLLGTPQVPNLAALSTIPGVITSIDDLTKYTDAGGDLLATHGMCSLPQAPSLADIKAFNEKAGRNPAEATASWALLQANVADDKKKLQIIKSVAKANANLSAFTLLVTNWVSLSDRTTISASMVASLVRSGLLLPKGTRYDSGNWGAGCVYIFNLAWQGRLEPEWHLHFRSAGKTTELAGGGWKNKGEKYGQGVKTFGAAQGLDDAIKGVNKWISVRI